MTAAALGRLLRVHGRVSQAPVTIRLSAGATVSVSGDDDGARALLRAVICQLAVAHSPDDVGVVAAVGEAQSAQWDWLKWLPHLRHGPAERDGRRLVVVVDGGAAPAPDAASAVLRIGPVATPDADLRIVDGAETVALTRPDRMTPVAALAVARRLAGYRPDREPAGGTPGWLARVGVGDPAHIDPKVLWDNQFCAPLRVPIGTSEDGGAVDLDIREAAADGMGPHGLCLGATGSGKSELLRTIALGMIARHSPETLNLVLVDFKGGATFLDLRAPATPRPSSPTSKRRRASSTGCAMPSAVRSTGASASCGPRATSRASPSITGRDKRAGRWLRCPRSSSSSTNSPNCSAGIRISSRCSWRSDGWADRWACTCCWPVSASTRAGCVVWTRTCPTGSA